MSRLTRNTAMSNINIANARPGMKPASSIPTLAAKRKAEVKEGLAPKRAALGDLTNARPAGEVQGKGGKEAGAMKKISGMIKSGKGSLALRGKEGKVQVLKEGKVQAVKKSNVVKVLKEQEAPTSSTSSSSEEGLMCVLDSDSSAEEKVVEIPVPARRSPPEGVEDFDLQTESDPQQHSEYAMETFQYYRNREAQFKVPSYIQSQPEINENMRAILVDWLVEVQESFELNHETLYTAVKMVDIYLSKKQVKKEDLQLIGATTCLIACKVDERIPPMVDDFLYVCDDAYTRDKLMVTERKVLQVVGFDLGFPLSYRYVRRYGRVCHVSMPVLTLARYILEMSLMEYSLNVEVGEAEVAVAALILALKMKNIEGWGPALRYYSGFHDLTEVNGTLQKLLAMLQQPPRDNLKTIRSKYSHRVFHEVATTPVPTSVTLAAEG